MKKETLEVFSCEFYKVFKKTFSCRTPPVAASGNTTNIIDLRKVDLSTWNKRSNRPNS